MQMAPGVVLALAPPGSQGDIFGPSAASGGVVKIVLLILLGFSILSWSVILERYRALKRAEADTIRFLRDLQAEKRLADLRERSARSARSPLVPIFNAGFRELASAITDVVGKFRGSPAIPDEARDRVLERVRRRLEEAAAAEAERLDQNFGILATTGSVTPFIGLFGTVWGVMNAFQAIGISGSARLAGGAPRLPEA